MERATRREDAVTIAFVSWTTIGLFVDAYFHSTDPGLESFWTPWHALFYSGFVATALWIVGMVYRRAARGTAVRTAAPLGYGAALIGLMLFAAGGAGDAVWHTLFGVETSLDALLSPTHLLLFVGLLLIASAPFRGAWSDPHDESARSWKSFGAPLFSLTWSTTLVAFFLKYGFLLTNDQLPRVVYNPQTGNGEFEAAYGLLAVIITTLLLSTPVLVMVRRWRNLPLGAIIAVVSVVTVFLAVGFDDDLIGIPAVIVGSVVAEVLVRSNWRMLMAAAFPIVTWSAYFLLVGRLERGIGWPPEVWGGMIFFSAITGLAVHGLLAAGTMSSIEPVPDAERVDSLV